jgi:UDPglucose--hexose-1-phosphate uridylyltransferase
MANKKDYDKTSQKNPSELRFDIVSKDWVVIATGRAKRPESFKKEKRIPIKEPGVCPFCDLSTQEKIILAFENGKKIKNPKTPPPGWSLIVLPNKYPAFLPGNELKEREEGIYKSMQGVGFHELVITRDHKKDIYQFPLEKVKEIFDAYQERYLELMNERFINYISIFHNHGYEAGASLSHPHSQIIAIPVTDPDIQNSLDGAEKYWDIFQRCIYCEMIKYDKQDGRRIVYENKEFIAVCPFASRMAFEVRIYPKAHLNYFERVSDEQKAELAEIFRAVLLKLNKALNYPAYNFFLRTAPCDGKAYPYYHWHFEIIPRTSIQAGFEFGAGIEISTIEPEKAAEYLRKF